MTQPTDSSVMTAIERVARVLAAAHLSANAEGSSPSASIDVDQAWPDHIDTAKAVLRTLREPDAAMTACGNPDMWCRMVEAAIEGAAGLDLPGQAGAVPAMPKVRAAGPENMSSPPDEWTREDQQVDESFPASDPAPASPGIA